MNHLIDQQLHSIKKKGETLRVLGGKMLKLEGNINKKRTEVEVLSAKLFAVRRAMNVCKLKTQMQQKRSKEIRSTIINTIKTPAHPTLASGRLEEFLQKIVDLQSRLASLPNDYDPSRIVTETEKAAAEQLKKREVIIQLQKNINQFKATAMAERANDNSVRLNYAESLSQIKMLQSMKRQRLSIAHEQHQVCVDHLAQAKAQLAGLQGRGDKMIVRLDHIEQSQSESVANDTQRSWTYSNS